MSHTVEANKERRPPTPFEELMGLIREKLYVPDRKPKEPGGDARDAKILKRWLTVRTADEIRTAIEGFVWLRDHGHLNDWIPPNTKVSLRALALPANGGIRFFEQCITAGFRAKYPKKGQPMASLGDILRKAAQT